MTNATKEVLAPQSKFEDLEDQMSPFARTVYTQKYALRDHTGNCVERWQDTAYRVTFHVLDALGYSPQSDEFKKIYNLISSRKFIPGGRYLYSAGRELHQVNNCLLLGAEDSREGWSTLLYEASMALMTGAGIGIVYSDIRSKGTPLSKTGGLAGGPLGLMAMINECGRHIQQGGSRRAAIWAGLNWFHPDCKEFIQMKNWSPEVRALKEKDFNSPATMDMTNISVLLDDHFFEAFHDIYHIDHALAQEIYWMTLKSMVKTAEPGFSIDIGSNAGETKRNACCELSSHDSSDICNLGSLNLSRLESIEEFEEAVEYATLFLLAGTVYSHVPYDEVAHVREKNRRLGLGLMGVHEWLLKRGYRYEPNEELGEWLGVYAQSTEHAHRWALRHDLSLPVKTRAIAPAGTIGIVGETTTGIEPIFCIAYKRRYLSDGTTWRYQYVVDPTARRLIEDEGVNPDSIEDAYSLSYDVERRIAMQAFVQKYVDHGISSTINTPYPMIDADEVKDFGDMLMTYLPDLRGVTLYPDGARGGQPLTAVPYHVAIQHEGVVFEEQEGGRCLSGSCGV